MYQETETSRYSRAYGQNRRQTIWPTSVDGYGEHQLSAPWPARNPSFRIQNKRWTGAFESEARAARMSVMVDNSLFPQSRPRNTFHQQWVGRKEDEKAQLEPVWSGEFDVERRPSWVSRNSERFSGDFELEKFRKKATVSEEQFQYCDKSLLTREIMEYQFEGHGTERNPYLVMWIDNDTGNPLNFSTAKKWTNAMVLALAVFLVSIGSSGFSQGTEDLKTEFHVSQVTALLTTSTFVLGFAVGALILSPLSEVYGRKELYILTFGAFVGFSAATGLVNSMNAVIALRFFGGLAGSFTQAVAPAVVADIFDAQERGFVLSIFTLAGLMGQNLGPIICGFLDKAYGWRAIPILITAASLPTWLILAFTFPETYAPVLLQRRAQKLTNILGTCHVVQGVTPKPIGQQLRVGALRPWLMLVFEPIVILLSLFLSVVHGTLFLLFAAYPIVFQKVRGWPQGVASLPFLAIVLGIVISLFYVALVDQARYARVVSAHNGSAPPEARLPPAMLGSAALPIGLFWFAWTNDPSTFWLISVSAGTLFGFGMVLLYMSLTNYLVDAYLGYAASALAASTVLRSVAGAIFPLFTSTMYETLGIHWASSIPGFLALVFVPCLVGFWKWGHIIRRKTRFGLEAAKLAELGK
ncbi:major facilitator superfamily domain-containing protein [Dendryphion nanum]|uniref:Major facilitator superfamily domain-containing protein n=1 Tax=Dendryphion nanum TaxID=256645 RepID=A0A9P9E1W6_9PLEO|nr:major facilitator superfamily domain-containing protein [Dendryphion nanum]